SVLIALHVRKQRQVARTLHCRADLPLMPRAHLGHPTRQELALLGHQAAQRALILVVHVPDARLTERAVLCWTSHDLVLLLVVVLVTRSTRGDRHWRGRLTLVQHYQIAEQLLVELQQTLVLGKLRRARL